MKSNSTLSTILTALMLFICVIDAQATAPPYNQIASGASHIVSLKSDGTVWSWGANYSGQLGNGTTADSPLPVKVATLSSVIMVSAGGDHTVALQSDGTLWAWGGNSSGELGDGSVTNRLMPVKVMTNVKTISAGFFHTVVVKNDNSLWAWGSNGSGQLGVSAVTYSTLPQQVIGVTGVVTALSAGLYHTVAVAGGTVFCWGSNGYGQLGNNTTNNSSAPVMVPGLTGVTAVAAGSYHTVAMTDTGALWEWGSNTRGQLGVDTITNYSTIPIQPKGVGSVKALAAGFNHTVAVTADGAVWSWGANSYGQLGNGTKHDSNSPTTPAGLSMITLIAAGGNHTLALKDDGTLWGCGNNDYGQVGNGIVSFSTLPLPVAGFTLATALAGGGRHTVAIADGGFIWNWGDNVYGQLGSGDYADRPAPVRITSLLGAEHVAAGENHSVAVVTGGQVWSWGDNSHGQLGNGTTTTSPIPVLVNGLTGITAIAAGNSHTVALKSDRTVWAWGDNYYGQLGNGTQGVSAAPVQSAITDVVAIAASDYRTVALKSNGTVWYWGKKDNNVNSGDLSPVQSPLTGITAIAAGFYHTLALRGVDGTVWAWGPNYYGELGDGTIIAKTTPVQVSGLTAITAIAAGNGHSLAVKTGGTLWSWGDNVSGELGDGTSINRLKPVQLSGVTGMATVAAGNFHSLALSGSGQVTAWGWNAFGQLNGATTSLPQQALLNLTNTTSPSVVLVAPASGATYTPPATITLKANTASPSATITKVEFYNGATLLGSDTTSPYSYSWTTVSAGIYSLTAKAYDSTGAVTTSETSTVTVASLTFYITTTAGAHGSITPTATVNYGASSSVTVTPDSGYHIASLLVDGVSQSITNPKSFSTTFSSVVADHTVSATFAADIFTITTVAGTYGSITPTTVVSYGTGVTIIVTPNSGYHIATIFVDGVSQTIPDPMSFSVTFSPVITGHTVNATFANAPPTVTLTTGTTFTAPASIIMTATAADSDGTVSRVEFYNGATLLGYSTTAPYSYTWSNVAAGSYPLTAKAYDNLGAVTTSGVTTITVAPALRTNVALQANGGVATASSYYNTVTYPVAAVNNGDRKGGSLGGGGVWSDATNNLYPDWVQITFNGQKTIDEVDLFSLQDLPAASVEPTPTLTFTKYGINAFDVQYWDGTTWLSATNSGITGNNLVWRKVSFSAVTTDRIRLVVTSSLGAPLRYSRIVEIEAYGSAVAPLNSPPTVTLTTGTNYTAPATVTLAATATDSDGTISKVEFYNGSTLLWSGTTAPYSFSWTDLPAGSYTVTAKAYDNLGAVTTSAAATITVAVAALPAPTITSISPTGITLGNAASVTIDGANLTGATVTFSNGTVGTATTTTATRIVIPITGSTVGTGTVTVTTAGGSATGNLTVTAAPGIRSNVALAANGGVATASSVYTSGMFPISAVNDGGRIGKNWGKGGFDSGWNDNTSNVWPDWVQITFNGSKNINEIDLYTLGDNYATATADPTLSDTFTKEGNTSFDVQYWDVTTNSWLSVAPGALPVTGNNNVWRQFTFAPVTTNQIRVLVYATASSVYKYSRIVEFEAYQSDGVALGQPTITNVTPGSVVQGIATSVSITGTNLAGAAIAFSNATASGVTVTDTRITAVVTGTVPNAGTVTVSTTGGSAQSPFTVAATPLRTNVALAANGGTATASSVYINGMFPIAAVNDGGRIGKNWGKGGFDSGWNDNTSNAWPDWVQITFNGSKNINEIDLYTLGDNYATATADPTLSDTFTKEGNTSFDVQYWDVTTNSWLSVAPGALPVTGNNNVWRQFTFAPVTTNQIRVLVYATASSVYKYSRIVEIEVYGF